MKKTHLEIIRDCQLAHLWSHPFAGWPKTNLKGLLKLVSRIALERTRYAIDICHWKRLSHLGCVRPSGYTSPRDIFGTVSYAADETEDHPIICLIALFVQKTISIKSSPQHQETLHSLTRHLKIFSWNVTSLKGQDTRREKAPHLKRILEKGPVMLQETKVPDEAHGMNTHIPMAECRSLPAVEGRNAGGSGGLLWVIPQHAGYSDTSAPCEVVRGLLGYIRTKFVGITIMLVNVYAPPDRRGQTVRDALKKLLADEATRHDLVVIGGDLNLDPERPSDTAQWEDFEHAAIRQGLHRAPIHDCTFAVPGGRGTTIDHFFYAVMEEGSMRLGRRPGHYGRHREANMHRLKSCCR